MAENQKPRRWWYTLPGILTAVVALISAVTGLIVALREAGLFDQKSVPQLTITATVHPDEECIHEADFGIRTMSSINVGINNKSESDAILNFVELVPEWITGNFWAGMPVVSKEYTVILNEWHDRASVAMLSTYKPELREKLFASGRIKEDKDWYLGHNPIFWV